jgi:hypothetical protein
VSRRQLAGAAAPISQMWNVISIVLACAAGLLFAAGYTVAGGVAFVLCAGGYALRRRAMRK